jgi:hypothetical protein
VRRGTGTIVWQAPGYSFAKARAERAAEHATWKRVEVKLPRTVVARLERLTARHVGWNRADVLRYVIPYGLDFVARAKGGAR